MNLYGSTSKMLWYGGIAGIVLIAAGLVLSMAGFGDSVLWLGILVLIASPMAGVFVSMIALLSEKDRKWATVAMLLILLTVIGTAISWII